ncbi:MAG: magnesium transporter [Thermotogae bacterium]|nr:magnesium transporter [Thermotogota bacterium]
MVWKEKTDRRLYDVRDKIKELLHLKDFRSLKRYLTLVCEKYSPVDMIRVISGMDTVQIVMIFRLFPKDYAADVFTLLEKDEQKLLIQSMAEQNVAALMKELEPDERTDLFEELPAGMIKKLLLYLTPEERKIANELLNYPEDSAGRLMTPEYVDLKANMTADGAIEHIRKTAPDKETIYTSYVIDERRKLLGIVPLKDLLLSRPESEVKEIMNINFISVNTLDDQEDVARTMQKYDLLAVPVVDSEKRLVGIITIDDVVDVIEEENTEDVQRMALLEPIELPYLHTSPFVLVKKRITWLALLMILESATSFVMQSFQDTIRSAVALSFFVPMMIDTGGNVGTQSSTIIIRSLATRDVKIKDFFNIVLRESLSAALLGFLLSLIAFARVMLTTPNLVLAMSISLSLAIVIFLADVIGATLPIFAKVMKIDPAVMAGPIITTIVDIGGMLVYFIVATKIFNI